MSLKLLSQSEVVGVIATLGADATKIQAQIHLSAVSTLAHIRDHGDTRGATQLLNALPNGTRVKALAQWYRHFSDGAMTLRQAPDSKAWECKLAEKRVSEQFDVVAAEATTFADLTVERDPVTLTLDKFIKSLARTANNDDLFDGTTQPKVSPEVRAVAARMLASFRASEIAIAA